MRFLNVDAEEARRIQKAYYRDHGTTLTGLIKLHDADPEEFLAEVHDIDLAAIDVDSRLIESIAALPGKRFVFTNGCRHHAERVLIRTGLTDFFEDIWDIRTTRFTTKPLSQSYDHILAHSGVDPRKAAMFEDISRNLVPAHALGMTRVLAMRLVILPQALARVTPMLTNQLIVLLKDTSLLASIGVLEMTLTAKMIIERTGASFQVFVLVALAYLAMTSALGLLARALELRQARRR